MCIAWSWIGPSRYSEGSGSPVSDAAVTSCRTCGSSASVRAVARARDSLAAVTARAPSQANVPPASASTSTITASWLSSTWRLKDRGLENMGTA